MTDPLLVGDYQVWSIDRFLDKCVHRHSDSKPGELWHECCRMSDALLRQHIEDAAYGILDPDGHTLDVAVAQVIVNSDPDESSGYCTTFIQVLHDRTADRYCMLNPYAVVVVRAAQFLRSLCVTVVVLPERFNHLMT